MKVVVPLTSLKTEKVEERHDKIESRNSPVIEHRQRHTLASHGLPYFLIFFLEKQLPGTWGSPTSF
jgi:hypothetical protein